jgi:hypothetical protein
MGLRISMCWFYLCSMRKLLTIFFFSLLYSAPGQQLAWLQTVPYSGSYGNGVAVSPSGVVTAGGLSSWSLNYYWYFICKYDLNGTLLWSDTCGAHEGPQCAGVVADQFGNSYVSVWTPGWNSSLILNNTAYQGGGKMLLIKYSPNGQILWVNCQNGQFEPKALTINLQDEVYVTGTAGSGGFINVFNSTGNCIQTIPLPGHSYDISVEPSGELFTLHQHVITKRSSNGNSLWSYPVTGAQKLTTDNSGNCSFTGVSGSSTYISKLDPSGQLIWSVVPLNGAGGTILCTDNSGNIYSAGKYGMSNQPNGMGVGKYDGSGNLIWSFQLPTPPNNPYYWARKDITVKGGNVYISGYKDKQNAEGYLLKLTEPSTTSFNDLQTLHSLTIAPNPNSGQFIVSYKSSKKNSVTLEIRDANGKRMYLQTYPNFSGEITQPIDFSDKPKGIYMVVILSDKTRESIKVVVE